MIGDNYEKDIVGAKNAGMKTILFNLKGINGTFPLADAVVRTMNEFTGTIEKLWNYYPFYILCWINRDWSLSNHIAISKKLFPFSRRFSNFAGRGFGDIRQNHFHSGIDIRTGGEEGKPVYAVADGYVSRIIYFFYRFGCSLHTHPNGFTSLYGHLKKLTVLSIMDEGSMDLGVGQRNERLWTRWMRHTRRYRRWTMKIRLRVMTRSITFRLLANKNSNCASGFSRRNNTFNRSCPFRIQPMVSWPVSFCHRSAPDSLINYSVMPRAPALHCRLNTISRWSGQIVGKIRAWRPRFVGTATRWVKEVCEILFQPRSIPWMIFDECAFQMTMLARSQSDYLDGRLSPTVLLFHAIWSDFPLF